MITYIYIHKIIQVCLAFRPNSLLASVLFIHMYICICVHTCPYINLSTYMSIYAPVSLHAIELSMHSCLYLYNIQLSLETYA